MDATTTVECADEYDDNENPPEERYNHGSTYRVNETYDAALAAVQCTLEATERVSSGRSQNAFAIVRPPGHHAGVHDKASGFCFFNNVVIAAKSLSQGPLKSNRVLIVDWDLHHGDGTQHLIRNDPNIMLISIQLSMNGKFYPGTGASNMIENNNPNVINVGWTKPRMGDAEYLYAFQNVVQPAAKTFQPDFILISCVDSMQPNHCLQYREKVIDHHTHMYHRCYDPLASEEHCSITPEGYSMLLAKLMEIQPRIISVLEGGYNLGAINQSTLAMMERLTNNPQFAFHKTSLI